MERYQRPDWTEDELQYLAEKWAEEVDKGNRRVLSLVATNGIPDDHTAPLTLDAIVKMKEDFDKKFPEPIKYKNGADMSPETFKALGIPIVKTRECGISGHSSTLYGIDVHIVPDMPFGAVEECRCSQRKDYLDALEFKEKK